MSFEWRTRGTARVSYLRRARKGTDHVTGGRRPTENTNVSHTVLVVEDDAPTRRRIATAVEAREGLRVIGEAGDLAVGKSLLIREAPDVLLIDLGLPDGSGVELIAAARAVGVDLSLIHI